MSSATLRAGERVEFAPLRNFDVEDTGIIHDDEIGDDDGAPTQASERQLLFRALYVQDAGAFPDVTLTATLILWQSSCWTLCSATAIYTTKRLMTIHGYRKAVGPFCRALLTYSRLPYVAELSLNASSIHFEPA
jgi:hypothetical protein